MGKKNKKPHICDENCRPQPSDTLIRCLQDFLIANYNDNRAGNKMYISSLIWDLSDADIEAIKSRPPDGLSVFIERLVSETPKRLICNKLPQCTLCASVSVTNVPSDYKVEHTSKKSAHAFINCTDIVDDDIKRVSLRDALYDLHEWYHAAEGVDLHKINIE